MNLKRPRRKGLKERIEDARSQLNRGGLQASSDELLLLVLSEIRATNGRINQLMGVISVLAALIFATLFR